MQKYEVYYEGQLVTKNLDLINFGDSDPSEYTFDSEEEAKEIQKKLTEYLNDRFGLNLEAWNYRIKIKIQEW